MTATPTTVVDRTRSSRVVDRTRSSRRTVAAGLLGALLFVGGVGCYLAMTNPPYQQDESSHVGYALSLREGVLPSLDTPVPTEGGDATLKVALERPWPFSVPEIHVANNPPFPYLIGLPLTELSMRSGVSGGPLLGMRLLNLMGGVGAIACAYLLGRELSGDDKFMGLVTAGLLSGVIAITLVTATANVDGPAFAATTGVTWALARFARTRARMDATWLGFWCAGAAAVRPMSLAFAAVAGALALFLGWRAGGRRTFVSLTTRLAAPTLLLTGWFYVLNVHRYGDFTGSRALFERFSPQPGPNLFELLTGPEPFVQPLTYLATEVYGRSPWWQYTGSREYLISVLAMALLAGAIALAIRSARSAAERGEEPKVVPAAWISVAVLGATPMVLIAQHMSGGGAGHPRYLLPVLPIVSAAAALVTSRINRWLPVLAVAGFALAQATRIRAAGNLPVPKFFGPALRDSVVGQPFRALSVIVAIAGSVVLLMALARMASVRHIADE